MATWEKREHLIVDTFEDNRSKGKSAIGFTAKTAHSDSDPSNSGGGNGADVYPREATSHEQACARRGQLGAVHGYQELGPFTPTNGMHAIGPDHADCFARSVNMSGGVRQGSTFTSDPASGVARAAVKENNVQLHPSSQGSGETFQIREQRRIAGYGG